MTKPTTQREWTIGRAVDCDIVIDRDSISGRHAVLRRDRTGQVRIEDLNSRNGIYLDAEGRQKVSTTILSPGQTIYFGIHPVRADELLSHLPPLSPIVVEAPTTATSAKDPKNSWIGWVFGAVMSGMLFIGVTWLKKPSDSRTAIPSLPTSVESASTAKPEQLVEDIVPEPMDTAIEDAMVWLAVRHTATGNSFRLGSGVAMQPDRVIVPASLVETMQSLLTEGFDQPSVIGFRDGTQHAVQESGTSPKYESAVSALAQRTQSHEALIAKLETGSLTKTDARSAFDESVQLLASANEELKAVDVGWLRTIDLPMQGTLTSEDLASEITFRPGQSLEVLDGRLEMEDPFFESTQSSAVRSTRFKVLHVGTTSELGASPLVMTTGQGGPDYNWLGAPVVQNGKLVGMIIEQASPPSSESDDANEASEPVWFAVTYPSIEWLLKK